MTTIPSRLARLAAAATVALGVGALAAGPASAAWTEDGAWSEDGAGSDALILGASDDDAGTHRWWYAAGTDSVSDDTPPADATKGSIHAI